MALTVETAYNRIRAYFSKPGADYAVDTAAGVCKYRIEKDRRIRKCAIGCLIPARDYKPRFDGMTFHVDKVLDSMGVDDANLRGFLKAVQGAHDDSAHDGQPILAFLTKLDKLYEEYRPRQAA